MSNGKLHQDNRVCKLFFETVMSSFSHIMIRCYMEVTRSHRLGAITQGIRGSVMWDGCGGGGLQGD